MEVCCAGRRGGKNVRRWRVFVCVLVVVRKERGPVGARWASQNEAKHDATRNRQKEGKWSKWARHQRGASSHQQRPIPSQNGRRAQPPTITSHSLAFDGLDVPPPLQSIEQGGERMSITSPIVALLLSAAADCCDRSASSAAQSHHPTHHPIHPIHHKTAMATSAAAGATTEAGRRLRDMMDILRKVRAS